MDHNSYDNDSNENDVVVNKEDFVTINDPDCEHKFKNEGEDMPGFNAWRCAGCKRGVIYPVGITIK